MLCHYVDAKTKLGHTVLHTAEQKLISECTLMLLTFFRVSKLFGAAAVFPLFFPPQFCSCFSSPLPFDPLSSPAFIFSIHTPPLLPPLSQIISPARSSFHCQGVSFFLQKCLIPLVLTGLPVVSGQEELKDGMLDCRGRLPRVKLCSRRSRTNNKKSGEGITYRHAMLGTCLLLERS